MDVCRFFLIDKQENASWHCAHVFPWRKDQCKLTFFYFFQIVVFITQSYALNVCTLYDNRFALQRNKRSVNFRVEEASICVNEIRDICVYIRNDVVMVLAMAVLLSPSFHPHSIRVAITKRRNEISPFFDFDLHIQVFSLFAHTYRCN